MYNVYSTDLVNKVILGNIVKTHMKYYNISDNNIKATSENLRVNVNLNLKHGFCHVQK